VLLTDPGMGIVRHVDAGYEEATEFAERTGVRVPAIEVGAVPDSWPQE
jgi:urocanate hydratase